MMAKTLRQEMMDFPIAISPIDLKGGDLLEFEIKGDELPPYRVKKVIRAGATIYNE